MIHLNHTLRILWIDGSIIGGTPEHLSQNHQNHLTMLGFYTIQESKECRPLQADGTENNQQINRR